LKLNFNSKFCKSSSFKIEFTNSPSKLTLQIVCVWFLWLHLHIVCVWFSLMNWFYITRKKYWLQMFGCCLVKLIFRYKNLQANVSKFVVILLFRIWWWEFIQHLDHQLSCLTKNSFCDSLNNVYEVSHTLG